MAVDAWSGTRSAFPAGRRGGVLAVCILVLAIPGPLRAEQRRAADDAWAFHEAWRTFRVDLDASVPGEHGQSMLIDHAEPGPQWLVRDAIRISRSAPIVSRLAHRAVTAGDAAAVPALRQALAGVTDARTRLLLERALVRLGDEQMQEQLGGRLERGSTTERWQAASSLVLAGAKAVPILVGALSAEDDQTRMAAASALVSLGDARGAKMLGEMLSGSDPYRQLEAAHALALAGDARAVPVLRDQLKRPGCDRGRLARSLGFVGTAPERDLLRSVLDALPGGGSQTVRLELFRALGRITMRVDLADLAPAFASLGEDPDDDGGVLGAWREALGRAAARGVVGRAPLARAVEEGLGSPQARESPVAFDSRRERVLPLVGLLTTGRIAPRLAASPRPGSVDVLLERLRVVGGDADDRIDRFAAALELLERTGERLGYPALSEPPEARAVGLGAGRAVDGNALTSWIAGEAAGALRLDLVRPLRARRLLLIGGCTDSRESFRRHARVSRLGVRLDGGPAIEGRLRDDDPWFQEVELPGSELSRVEIEVLEVHPGEQTDAPACIAEIRLR